MTIKWQTKLVQIKDLKDFEHNPRKMSIKDFGRLVRDIKEDGYHKRLLVNLDMIIIGGHSRKRALLKAGYKETDEIEVLMPDKLLDEKDFEKINIKDNVGFGDWDTDILSSYFEPVDLVDWGITDFDVGIDDKPEKEEKPKKTKECPECGAII